MLSNKPHRHKHALAWCVLKWLRQQLILSISVQMWLQFLYNGYLSQVHDNFISWQMFGSTSASMKRAQIGTVCQVSLTPLHSFWWMRAASFSVSKTRSTCAMAWLGQIFAVSLDSAFTHTIISIKLSATVMLGRVSQSVLIQELATSSRQVLSLHVIHSNDIPINRTFLSRGIILPVMVGPVSWFSNH